MCINSAVMNPSRIVREQVGADLCVALYKKITGHDNPKLVHPSQLCGCTLTREHLDAFPYESLQPLILELRSVYSASGMRCLRADAGSTKSPVLNLLRQVSKANGLHLASHRKASGYHADGRKKFTYWYTFEAFIDDLLTNTRTEDEKAEQPSQ